MCVHDECMCDLMYSIWCGYGGERGGGVSHSNSEKSGVCHHSPPPFSPFFIFQWNNRSHYHSKPIPIDNWGGSLHI